MTRESSRLTRGDWLAAALDALERHGIGGVRVQTLAKLLGVTTGSFYWHFENRHELCMALLDYWEGAMTDSVLVDVTQTDCTPAERVWKLMETVVFQNRARYDAAMRTWARADEEVAERVRQVEHRRQQFVAGLFRDAGFSKQAAWDRGVLLANYLMGSGVLLERESEPKLRRMLRRQWKVLLRADA